MTSSAPSGTPGLLLNATNSPMCYTWDSLIIPAHGKVEYWELDSLALFYVSKRYFYILREPVIESTTTTTKSTTTKTSTTSSTSSGTTSGTSTDSTSTDSTSTTSGS